MKNKIVIGTWPMSGDWGSINFGEVINTLEQSFYKYDFKEYDTAPNYGNGFSEFILGKIFSNENEVIFNTKVGSFPFDKKSFDCDDIKLSVEQSLYRLNKSSINILFLHNPRDEIKNYDKIINLLNDYKTSGVIKYFGISCAKGYDYSNCVDLNQFDYVQDDINLLCLDTLIKSNKNNFYARSPLASGLLSGKISDSSSFEESDHRSEWLKGERLFSLLKRVNKIKNLSNEEIISLASRFLLSSSKIYKIIFGIRNIAHLKRLFDLKDSKLLETDLKKKIIKLYENDFGLKNEGHLKY